MNVPDSQFRHRNRTLHLDRDLIGRPRRRRSATAISFNDALDRLRPHSFALSQNRSEKSIPESLLISNSRKPIDSQRLGYEVTTHNLPAKGGSMVTTIVVDRHTGLIADWLIRFVEHGSSPATSGEAAPT